MNKVSIFVCSLLLASTGFAQKSKQQLDKIITEKEVTRIETILADDKMEGRGNYTPGIERAADFIADEFRKAGLQPIANNSFRQPFAMIKPDVQNIKATLNGKPVADEAIIVVSTDPVISITSIDGFDQIRIGSDDNFARRGLGLMDNKKPTIIAVDPANANVFARLKKYKKDRMSGFANVIFLLTKEPVTSLTVTAENNIKEMKLANVVGILPGKSKKEEYVIFSGHYDHLGIGTPQKGDSLYNGANDDASGITAVIALANYFSQTKDNERTIIFAAFTAEEIGGFGSQYFSQQFNPAKVMAMFNIEMIGTDSKWGLNSAYITGYEKTDMGKIMEKNLVGTEFKFHPDPYTEQQLFYRSDNATLARLGVPAHTISTSKMDSEPHYHTSDDEIETLDLANMTRIIKAIALSSATIVSGKDTPSRVDTSALR